MYFWSSHSSQGTLDFLSREGRKKSQFSALMCHIGHSKTYGRTDSLRVSIFNKKNPEFSSIIKAEVYAVSNRCGNCI